MNANFAARISSYFEYNSYNNAEIAKYYKINKSTVARIRKIYEDVRFKKINPESVAILAKRNHVSKNTILAIAGKAKGVKRFY